MNTQDWKEEFAVRFARHADELKWLYMELYHNDAKAWDKKQIDENWFLVLDIPDHSQDRDDHTNDQSSQHHERGDNMHQSKHRPRTKRPLVRAGQKEVAFLGRKQIRGLQCPQDNRPNK